LEIFVMKKSLVALAVLAASGAAMAQSSVTLYGIVDADVASATTNGVVGTAVKSLSQTQVRTDGLSGNRWGLKGSEDLGGGLSAVFNVESGFAVDTGASAQGGLLFGRRANVGLAGGFGRVELGRNSSSYEDVAADHSMMGESSFDPSNYNTGPTTSSAAGLANTAAGASAFLGRVYTWVGYATRFNNSIKYTSPNFSGFTGSFMYALGEDKTATTDASKSISAYLKYVNGPLLVSGGYQSEASGGSLPSVTAGVPTSNSAVTTTKAPALENTLLSVAYNFGPAKLGMGFNRAVYKDVKVTASLGGGDFAAQNGYDLSVAVPFGATTVSATYAVSDGDTLGKSTGFGVQALYALSKRTTLYVGAVSTSVYDKLAAAVTANTVGSDIQRNSIYAAGVKHTF
jgi:predicted porin